MISARAICSNINKFMLKFCSSPWDTVHIGQNGEVWFCLCPNWNKRGAVGNLLENSLVEICNNQLAKEFKHSVLDQSYRFCDVSQCAKLYLLDPVDNFDFVPDLPRLPTTLAMAIDRNCNLKCASCRSQSYYTSVVDPTAKSLLEKIIKEYQNCEHTVFIRADGSGDCFASAAWLEFFHAPDLPKCFKFSIVTNGNLIVKNIDILTKLYSNNQLESVNVSLDAATAETYKKTRGGNLSIVLDGIKQMVQIGIKVAASFVLQQKNWQEVFDYYELCKSLGVSNVAIQSMDPWGHMTEQWYADNQVINHPEVDQSSLLEMLIKFKNVGTVDGGIENFIQTHNQLDNTQAHTWTNSQTALKYPAPTAALAMIPIKSTGPALGLLAGLT